MSIYIVRQNDSVDEIALNYGVDVQRIIYDNQLIYPYRLAVGQALYIGVNGDNGKRNIYCNGFAYPFISRWVLEQTLPYLSELSIFSYGFTPEGYLVWPQLNVKWMIDLAREYGTIPTLTLTPFDESGRFNNNLISSIVNNSEYKARLIDRVREEITTNNYGGLNIDFEYILASDRDAFTAFVQEMTYVMRENGIITTVDMAPKTSSTQSGLLYEGKDYAGLGAVSDYVLLMTYEWGYTYGPAMAVAPINKVKQVVDYAVTQIDNSKINLGVPNYGYDGALPYIAGKSKAQTIGNIEAVNIAIANNAQIHFDDIAHSPYFNYIADGQEHEVWFEDVRSIQAKRRLYEEYSLHGLGYWQIMQLFRANWLILNE